MKPSISHTLISLLVLLCSVPCVKAQEYNYTVTNDWTTTFTAPSMPSGNSDKGYFQTAIAFDALYIVPTPYSDSHFEGTQTIAYKVTKNGAVKWLGGEKGFVSVSGPSGNYLLGPGIVSDSDGDLYAYAIFGNKAYTWCRTYSFKHWTSDPVTNGSDGSNYDEYRLMNSSWQQLEYKRADFPSAYGDIHPNAGADTGEGSIWLAVNAPDDNNALVDYIMQIKMLGGTSPEQIKFNLPEGVTVIGNSAYVQQYADNKVMFHKEGQSPIYIGTINGSKIDWVSTGATSIGALNQMFMLNGCEILAYASASNTITVKNLTTNTVIGTLTPFGDKISPNTVYYQSLASKVSADGMSADLYVYTPGQGVAKYTVEAVPDALATIGTVTAKVEPGNDSNLPGRQDGLITWTLESDKTPAVGPSSYKIYYRTRYWNSDADHTYGSYGEWSLAGTAPSGATEFRHKDIKWEQSKNNQTLQRQYEYKVAGFYAAADSVVVTSNEITPAFIPWTPRLVTDGNGNIEGVGLRNYPGYCKVQFLWHYPSETESENRYGLKPDYYSILRDGATIWDDIVAFNFIDNTCAPNTTYKYQIIAHYYSVPDQTGKSDVFTVEIGARDPAKASYRLEEIYNYGIGNYAGVSGKVVANDDSPNLTVRDDYRQAAYYRAPGEKYGYWYIAQRSNKKKIKDAAGKTIEDPTATSGIIRVAAEPNENGELLVVDRLPNEGVVNSNVGIACDDGGNLFVNHKTITSPATGAGVESNNFFNKMNKGKVLIKNANGTYTEHIVDLTLGGKFDFAKGYHEDKRAGDTSVPGRCDYYAMKGNLTGNNGTGTAYLYLAPSVTRAVYVFELTYDGTQVKATKHYEHDDWQAVNTMTGEKFTPANENYAFPFACEDVHADHFMHLIRSNAYVAHDMTPASGSPSRIGPVYETYSRINNAGGCTLKFNDEMFVITPQNQFSVNTGNFYVGMAERAEGMSVADANVTSIVPAAMFSQNAKAEGGGSNSNAVWLAAELVEDDINKDGNFYNDYAFIYMYVPGTRIAKYALIASTTFDPTPITLNIDPVYANNDYDKDHQNGKINPGDDITRFKATATWEEVPDYGTSDGGNSDYDIYGYSVKLYDANNTLVQSAEIKVDLESGGIREDFSLEGLDAVSDRVDDFNNPIYSYTYEFPGEVDRNANYNVSIQVVYVTAYGGDDKNAVADAGYKFYSDASRAQAINNYVPVAATGAVQVHESIEWADWDEDKDGSGYKGTTETSSKMDPDDGYWRNYHVAMDIDNPNFNPDEQTIYRVEPRTYYYISAELDPTKDGRETVENIYLYDPENGNADVNGYVLITDGKIPGGYDFSCNDKKDGKPNVYWNEQDYIGYGVDGGDKAKASNAVLNPTFTTDPKTNPSDRDYYINSVYAGTNSRIMQSVNSIMVPGDVLTGVEDVEIEAVDVFKAYPVPAQSMITINSAQAIEHVEVISLMGGIVKSVVGNGESVMMLDISDLASGYYLLRVNNLAPLRIIKN